MQVSFAHPTSSDLFQADCDPQCTGQLAIDGLIGARFVERPARGTYDLVLSRTRAPIHPHASFESVGVSAGDLIQIFRRGAGAA